MTGDTLRRRTVLKAVGGTSIALAMGTGVVTADKTANGMGGTGFTTEYNIEDRNLLEWDAFKFVGENQYTLEQSPGCTDGEAKTYQGWDIEEVNGDRTANFWINPKRNVNTNEAVSIRNTRDGCKGAVSGGSFEDDQRSTYHITFGVYNSK